MRMDASRVELVGGVDVVLSRRPNVVVVFVVVVVVECAELRIIARGSRGDARFAAPSRIRHLFSPTPSRFARRRGIRRGWILDLPRQGVDDRLATVGLERLSNLGHLEVVDERIVVDAGVDDGDGASSSRGFFPCLDVDVSTMSAAAGVCDTESSAGNRGGGGTYAGG